MAYGPVIITLGSGFDTSFFRLYNDELLSNCRVFEVDFPSVIKRKLDVINGTLQLQKCIGQMKWLSDSVVSSRAYCAICCDITDLPALKYNLKKAEVDFKAPTLFISECVLTYISAVSVNALLAWSAASFSNAIFCCYEQIQPQDTFGHIMQNHFKQHNSPLRNINLYPTQESQRRRYQSAGWSVCRSCDMNTFFNSLPKEEQQRVVNLELFDEYEEWHLKCSHYFILCAFNGQCSLLSKQILQYSTVNEVSLHPIYGSCELAFDNLYFKNCPLKRYGHGSCLLSDGSIIIVGGYGKSPVGVAAPHSRLNDVMKIQPSTSDGWKLCSLDTQGTHPGKLMHLTVTAIAGGTSALVIGGRGSPAQPNQLMYLLQMDGATSSKALWSKVVLHPESSLMEPRWRHTANLMNIHGEECVLIVGGSCTKTCALADMYILSTVMWRLRKLCVSLPEGRCSHSSAAWHEGLIIAGGMNSSLQPVTSCLYLTHTLTAVWKLSSLQLSLPLPPKYSMSATLIGEQLVLLGGVGLHTTPDIIIINLKLKIWTGLVVPCADILLHKHMCHLVADQKVLVVGGGGNCFSFGTHLNPGLHSVDVATLFHEYKL